MNDEDFVNGPMAARSEYVIARQIPDVSRENYEALQYRNKDLV